MSASTAFLHTHLPWNFITSLHEGVVVQKDGILQRSFAYRAPDVDSSDAFSVNALALRVNDFAKRLGQGWAFQMEAQRFQTSEYPRADFYYPTGSFHALAPYLIDREREAAFRAAGRHFESSYYLTFTWRPPSEGVKQLARMFVRQDSPPDASAKSLRENAAFFVNETNAVAAVLSNNILLAPLGNEETAACLHSAVSLNRNPLRFPFTAICLDRILPDMELVNSIPMKLGDFFIPIVGVNDFPESTYPAILDGLNRARLEYRWSTRYICAGKEEGKKEAQKKEKAHRGSRKSFFQVFAESTTGEESRALNHGAGIKESDSIQAGIEIDTDEAALGFYTSSVMVWDKNLAAARKKAGLVKAVINSAGFTCKDENFNAFEAWKAMMPGQVYANFRALPVMSYTLSHAVPLSSVWAGTRANDHAGRITGVDLPHLVCSTAEGTPFFLNINPTDVGHTAVWGPTGAGKSTLLNLLETQFFKYPDSQVIVFDKGRSCRLPCLASGGLFFEPAGESAGAVSFQPLRDLETARDLADAIDFIESLFTVNGFPVTPPMRAAVKESLELLRDKHPRTRTLTSFEHYVNYLDPQTKKPVFKELLGDYFWDGGKFGKIFDAASSEISLASRFLAFEMEALMNRGEGCVVPALVYLFNLVEKKCDGRLTLLVLDEAWLFLKNELFAEKIAEWLKVLRKKNVFVVFATQDVADAERSPLKTTIVQQCLTKIYLADPGAATAVMADVYRAFGLTDTEIGLIAGATMKRDYFYTSPLGRRLFQLDLGPLTLSLIGGADHALLDRLLAENGPGAALCRELLESRRVNWRRYAGPDMPKEPRPDTPAAKPPSGALPAPPPASSRRETEAKTDAARLLDAVRSLPDRRGKGDGSGRAAEKIAGKFSVSHTVVYRARALLKSGDQDLIDAVRDGRISLYAAWKKAGGKTAAGEAAPTA